MRTTQPCPGCGEVYPYRGAKEVCPTCKGKLKFFDDLAEEQKRELKAKEIAQVFIPGASHWLPYIPHGRIRGSRHHDEGDLASTFQMTFRELALGLSDPMPNGGPRSSSLSIATKDQADATTSSSGEHRAMQPGVARCLRVLYDSTVAIANNAYADGRADGGALLAKLRAGEISTSDLEVQQASAIQNALARARRRIK